MTDQEATPDWVTPGAKMFVLNQDRSISVRTIDRLTKTRIVDNTGSWFSRRTLSRSYGYGSEYVYPVTDIEMRRLYRRQRANRQAKLVAAAAELFARTPSEELAQALEARLSKWRELAAL